MNQLPVIEQKLRTMKAELIQKYHIRSIGLFGSIVRDDFSEERDIDIIVDFTQPIGIEFIDLAELLEKKLQKKVDLVSKNGIKENYLRTIESEILYV